MTGLQVMLGAPAMLAAIGAIQKAGAMGVYRSTHLEVARTLIILQPCRRTHEMLQRYPSFPHQRLIFHHFFIKYQILHKSTR